ncbi:MAG: CDP-diacylglycerol--glycerol-3-phosphate 3-phosphatidyltransferase [Hyphomicrobiaceae bacterium]
MEQVALAPTAVNLPNLITYGRIAAVPAVVACLFFLEGDLAWWSALVIFILAAVSDYFDGFLARYWNQQSALGRMLDPIADKLLVGAVLLVLVDEGIIAGWSLWAAVIILSREILVSGLREFLAELSVTVHVTRLAKWKTAMQLIALGALLAAPIGESVVSGPWMIGIVLLWISAALTAYTGYAYLKASLHHAMPAAAGRGEAKIAPRGEEAVE